MPALRSADQEQLQKLLLGQLPSVEVERLATEYADDSRLAELAESLAGQDDALLHLLHNHETAVIDPDGERLVERLVQRLKPALPVSPRDDTAAMNRADVSTEPSSPAVTGAPQKLPERLEYYRPIKVLGQGGMGTVYLAEDTRLGREVAIKTLRPELAINPQAKERFLREARSAAKLEHDHIIPIYSVGEAADGTPFLAMPLLKGEPLDALIRRTAGPLSVATAVRLAREMASGLAAAHARGLIHRDIKPANIWLEAPTGRVKILDFGLAKAADADGDADSETHLTASGAIVGTPAYMAPEQASGHAVDGRADLFSLGCVLYELLSGKRAFSGPNTMSILMSLANHTPPAPDKLSPQCPAAMSRLVMQLLEKDPGKRPASADAVIQALADLDIAPATTSVQASRAASAPGLPPSNAAVRGLTPPGSPTRIDQTQSDGDVPSDGTILLSLVTPTRKPSFPKRRIALAGVLMMLLAAVVYRIETDKGTVVVEINDDTVEAKLKLNGIEIRDSKSGRVFTIRKLGDLREASGDFKVVDGQGLKLVVLDADGLELTTNEFKLVRDGKVRVRVTAETNGVASITSPQSLAADRRAAEYVLSIGGVVSINGQEPRIGAAADLPRGAFELTLVDLPSVSDAELAHLKDCKNITSLRLCKPTVSDLGVSHFTQWKNLTSLSLYQTQVTDVGLANFKDCNNLTRLDLQETAVTDAGLAYFKHCKNLTFLNLILTKTGDAGLVNFRECKNLTHLALAGTQATNAGLAYFEDSKNLTFLDISTSQIGDAGLAFIKDCKKLTVLILGITQLSDSGLEHVVSCPNLGFVTVKKTKVTEAGVKKLSAALPGCKIEWDGGVIEPRPTDPDRRAAEYVLSIGGIIKIEENGRGRQTNVVGDLPRRAFELTGVWFQENPKVSDAGLANLKGCKNLTSLTLFDVQVSDEGLAHFKDCKNLTSLHLAETEVSDNGLAFFKDCRNLAVLILYGTNVGDEGLAHFKSCTNLTYINLSRTPVTDAGLAHFHECKNLTDLHLWGANVSDAGLAHFKDCKNLTALTLGGTKVSDAVLTHFTGCKNLAKLELNYTQQVSDASLERLADYPNLSQLNILKTRVTEAGVKKLSAALPGCRIEWDGGVIEPKPATDR